MAGSTGRIRRIVAMFGAAVLIAGTSMTVLPAGPAANASRRAFRVAGSAVSGDGGGSAVPSGPLVGRSLAQGTSPAVRDMPRDRAQAQRAPRQGLALRHATSVPRSAAVRDSVRQIARPRTATPAISSFEGTNNVDGVVPPDPNGAVGPNDYVELVNQHYQVFDKTGVPRAAPVESAQMWGAFSSSSSPARLCNTDPGGDGTVLYDRGADRWLFSELAFSNSLGIPTGPYIECFAVSKTADPTGAYNVYAFLMSDSELPDYPKIGIWGNSYYLSANMFSSIFAATGDPAVWAFDRNAMLAGPPAAVQDVSFAGYVPNTYNTILPADVDGAAQPPAGSPEIFAGLDFADNTTMGLWQFSAVDWTNPGAASFTGPTNISVAAYNTLCGGSQDCLPQPGTSQKLDAISDRVMYRLAYRNFGDHEALAVVHSVNAGSSGNRSGVRWYEFDRPLVNGQPSGGFTVAQQGTYAPDTTTSRWMGSIAMNGAGDMALGYAATSASSYPSIRFTGRNNGDPAGQMTVAEGTIQAGAGAQTGYNRWGDYTRMAVDPVDDCTFWYVGEYYSANSPDQWHTRVGSFQLSSCSSSPDFSLAVTPTSQSAIQGTTTPGYTVTVNPANGFNSPVSLSVSGLPSGATGTFTPNPTSASSTLTVTTPASTPIGSYPLTITGTSGSLTHTAAATLAVEPAGNFSLTASPASQSVAQGQGTSYAMTVNPSNGFNSPVNLSVTGLPSGVTGSFSPNPTTAGSTLTLATHASTPPGTYTLAVKGISGNLTRTTSVSLTVTGTSVGTVLHIVSMNGYGQVGTTGWRAWADVTVADQNGKAVQGATVTFSFSGGVAAQRICKTNKSGYCSTSGKKVTIPLSQPSETILTNNVAKTSCTWDGVKFALTLAH
jgi:hypothetical protein